MSVNTVSCIRFLGRKIRNYIAVNSLKPAWLLIDPPMPRTAYIYNCIATYGSMLYK